MKDKPLCLQFHRVSPATILYPVVVVDSFSITQVGNSPSCLKKRLHAFFTLITQNDFHNFGIDFYNHKMVPFQP